MMIKSGGLFNSWEPDKSSRAFSFSLHVSSNSSRKEKLQHYNDSQHIFVQPNKSIFPNQHFCSSGSVVSQGPQLPWMSRSKWVGEPDYTVASPSNLHPWIDETELITDNQLPALCHYQLIIQWIAASNRWCNPPVICGFWSKLDKTVQRQGDIKWSKNNSNRFRFK